MTPLSEADAWTFTYILFAVVGLMVLFVHGWWGFLQSAVFVAVLGTNIVWQWTPNGYLAALLGIAAAWLATVTVSKVINLLPRVFTLARRQRLPPLRGPEQGLD